MTADVATTSRLVFEGALTMRKVEVVHALLREAIAQQSSVSIDCAGVTEADLSFIQLLIAARASARQAAKRLVLDSHPDGALLSTLTRGGFRITTDDDGQAPGFWFDGDGA